MLAVADSLLSKNLLCAAMTAKIFILFLDFYHFIKYGFDKGSDRRLYVHDLQLRLSSVAVAAPDLQNTTAAQQEEAVGINHLSHRSPALLDLEGLI